MRGGNLYNSCEASEETLASVAELMGSTQLLWPSDFPHEKPWEEFSGDPMPSSDALIYPRRRRAKSSGRIRAGCMGFMKKNFPPMRHSSQTSRLHRQKVGRLGFFTSKSRAAGRSRNDDGIDRAG
jgi:hypothetical protein